MNLIGCLGRPTDGRIIIMEKDINKISESELAKLRRFKIGFIFQKFNLIPRLSVLQNVELPTYANYKNGTNPHIRVIELLELVGLAERMYHKPTDLSGGQCQRVAIARSLTNTPLLILADETTGNLDSNTGVEIMNIFLHLNKQGRTIVMITHDSDVARYAGRVVHLKDGKIENN